MERARKREGPFLKKLRTILTQAFPPPDTIELEDDDGVIGIVASSRFEGLDSMQRQDLIWSEIDQHLPREERRRIVILVTVTPEENLARSTP